MSKVSIILLNYNSYEDTLALIKNIKKKINYNDYVIIVVDNCSTNESHNILSEQSKILNYYYISNNNNSGYAAGNNLGIRFAYSLESEYSWILNNDILLSDNNVLLKMIELVENNDAIAAVSPIVLKPSGGEDYPFIEKPTVWNMTFGYLAYKKRRHRETRCSTQVYRPQGCCMLLKNKSLKLIDEMDERTFLYCEEEILAERLAKIDKQCWICAETNVIHNHSKTIYSVMKKKKIVKYTIQSSNLYWKEYRKINSKLIRALVLLFKAMITYISY